VDDNEPVLPDYDGPCTSNVVRPLVEDPARAPEWMPAAVRDADQIVVLVLDGLGWNQMQERVSLLRGLTTMDAVRITTVAPTTTATALTSICTGLPPGEHGIIGYRMQVEGDVLNVLRWSTSKGDARESLPPESIQHEQPFEGHRPPVVVRAEFRDSGFTRAHLAGCRHVPYRMPSTLVAEILGQLQAGEPFVYAYYDGIDKIGHERGFGDFYDNELVFADQLVNRIMEAVPRGTTVVVTADHGQVQVDRRIVELDSSVLALITHQSGEGRFRWLHASPSNRGEVLARCRDLYGDRAWVVSRDQVVDDRWLGPATAGIRRDEAVRRLGDVALVPFDPISFHDPLDSGPYELVCRHGSMTEDEMHVPLLAHTV